MVKPKQILKLIYNLKNELKKLRRKYMIFIPGNTPSSKNSKRIITITNKKNGKKTTRLINSEVTEKYIKTSKTDWILNKRNFLKMLEGKEKPYRIELYFIRDSRRKFDYINAAQIVFDLMQEYGYIEDDDSTNIIPIFKGFEVDKVRTGVKIDILQIKGGINDDIRYVKNRDNFVAEALDLVTATINLLLLCKVTDLDFNKHIEKLNAYRNGKYKK